MDFNPGIPPPAGVSKLSRFVYSQYGRDIGSQLRTKGHMLSCPHVTEVAMCKGEYIFSSWGVNRPNEGGSGGL